MIHINWSSSDEYLEIDPQRPGASAKTLHFTHEQWDDGSTADYDVDVRLAKESSDSVIEVRYSREKNPHLKEDFDYIYWGTSRIFFPQTTEDIAGGRVEFVEDANSKVHEAYWAPLDARLSAYIKRAARNRRFRRLVLKRDGRCVLTGETNADVLDAAHILPVKNGGDDSPTNGVCLRTDLHRLYDAGAFRFDKDGRVVTDPTFSLDAYSRPIAPAITLPSTLAAVRKSLAFK